MPPDPTLPSRQALLDQMAAIVGAGEVLTAPRATRRYTQGIRFGGGPVAAVIRPGSLVEMWRVLKAVVAAGRAVILQAANTGLFIVYNDTRGLYDLIPSPQRQDRSLVIKFSRMFDLLQ